MPTDAGRLQLCGYSLGKALKGRPPDGVVLGGGPAGVLAQLVDDAAEASSAQRDCTGRQADVLLRFFYPDGGREAAVLLVFACPVKGPWGPSTPGTVFYGGRVRSLDPALTSILVADAGSYGVPSPPVTPDLFGLAAEPAERTAKDQGFTAGFVGEETYPAMAPGSVLLQFPPAWMGDTGNGIEVVLSVPHAAACGAGDIAFSYDGFQGATGNYFGNLTAWDTSAHYCELNGPVRLSGIGTSGHPVTPTVSFAVPPGTVISPTPTPPPEGAPAPLGEITAGFSFATPTPFACDDRPGVVPADWRLSWPRAGGQTVRNGGKGKKPFSVFCGSLRDAGGLQLG